jgi:hypothetical protein
LTQYIFYYFLNLLIFVVELIPLYLNSQHLSHTTKFLRIDLLEYEPIAPLSLKNNLILLFDRLFQYFDRLFQYLVFFLKEIPALT